LLLSKPVAATWSRRMSNAIPRVLLPQQNRSDQRLVAVLSRPELTHDRGAVIARRGAIKIDQQPRPCSAQSRGPLDEAWARLPRTASGAAAVQVVWVLSSRAAPGHWGLSQLSIRIHHIDICDKAASVR
jgi:hypothetical protein